MQISMQRPATAPWGLSISDADFGKLKSGFEPRDQDDKWRFSVMGHSSNISIHLIRVGTGRELYVFHLKPSDGGSSSGMKIETITWEQDKNGIHISEEQAKKEAVMISRSNLECDFDLLPEYDPMDMFNHPGAQIGAQCANGSFLS